MRSFTRRAFLRSVPGAVAVTAGCEAPTADVRGTDTESPATGWPMFRLDVENTGCRPDARGPTEDPTVQWSHETGAGIWSSPAVVEGTAYIGSHDTHLYAFDAERGTVRWRFGTDGRIESTPAVAGGTVYFASLDRNVYAVDAATGEERWRYETDGMVRSSPTVAGGTVYIGGNCRHLECQFYGGTDTPTPEGGEPGGHVFALDRTTGDLRWQFETGDEVVSTPAVGGGTVYVGSSDTNVYAIDATTGEERWRHPTDDWVLAAPTLVDGTVYVPSMDGTVYALEAATGAPVWTYETRARYISGSTAVCAGTVYLGVPAPRRPTDLNDLAKVHALSADRGTKRWTFTADTIEIGSSPAVTGDAIYVGSHNFHPRISTYAKCYAVSHAGEELWQFDVPNEGVGSSPAVVDGTVYFGGDDRTMYALTE